MRVLLDTNVAFWLVTANRGAVTPTAVAALQDPGTTIHLSAVVWWEIAIKRSLGKLEIGDDWAGALHELGFAPLAILPGHAAAVEELPWHHRDPFDRLLVAQARAEDLALVTADHRLAGYGVPVVW